MFRPQSQQILLADLLREELLKNKTYVEILEIVRNNSEGKIWLIGSAVYKTLVRKLYGIDVHNKDWDFIVQKIKNTISVPGGWEIAKNRFGNPKIKNGKIVLDIVPLDNIHSIAARKLEPTIENHLTGVSLTVYSIAYEINENLLMGTVGINSLLAKTVGVNNKDEYEQTAMLQGDYSRKERCAETLGFQEI